MITKYSMQPMQYAEIHALPYKYNVHLSTTNLKLLIYYNYSVLHSNITPQALTCLD